MRIARSNGSMTHIRYDHKSRPRLLEVVCPKCGGAAYASKQSEAELKGEVVGDLSPSFRVNDWQIKCRSCPERANKLSYDDLPTLFFSGGNLGVWAWNSAHANCIKDYVTGQDTSHNPYHWFMTYVPGKWKKHSDKTVSEIDKMQDRLIDDAC